MQKKSQDFSMEDIMRVAQSPAGQQLLAMLQKSDNGKLEQAVQQAKTGDYTQASQILRTMLSSSQAQSLLKELGDQ